MLGLANLALIGGLAAIAAPVLVHIAHRRQFRIARWGAMRFLVQVMAARRRRLLIEHWFLLCIRCAAIACLALALCRPFWTSAGPEAVLARQGAVAAVVLLDDSPSAMAGRDSEVFAAMKAMARAYIQTLGKGDEISIILGSDRSSAGADPFFDADAAQEVVAQAKPGSVAGDIPGLIEAGLVQLERHINPHAEIVLITDGYHQGWHFDARERWADVEERLSRPGNQVPPELVVALPDTIPRGLNIGVADMRCERSLIPVGREVGIRVRLVCDGEAGTERVTLRVSIDGRKIDERLIDIEVGSTREERFACVFPRAGAHLIEAHIDGGRDLIALDDRRVLSVQVEAGVGVVLVEGELGTHADGSLGHVQLALNPQNDADGLFRLRRVAAVDFDRSDIAEARVLVLADVPALDPSAVAAIESFVVAGGGVLVVPGNQTDFELTNRFWARGGHGFLPAAFESTRYTNGAGIRMTDRNHGALSAFADVDESIWRSANVYRYAPLAFSDFRNVELSRLLSLDDGSPLLIVRRRGNGVVAQFATALDESWSDLPRHAAFVPLVRGLIAELGAVILPPRNVRPGESLCWIPPSDFSGDLDLTGPDGDGIPLSEGTWEGRRAYFTQPASRIGGYQLRGSNVDVRFAVALPAGETALRQVHVDDIALASKGQARVLRGEAAIHRTFSGERSQPVELWRILLAACITLLVVESVVTGRLLRSQPVSA